MPQQEFDDFFNNQVILPSSKNYAIYIHNNTSFSSFPPATPACSFLLFFKNTFRLFRTRLAQLRIHFQLCGGFFLKSQKHVDVNTEAAFPDNFIIILRHRQRWCNNFSKIPIGSGLTCPQIEEACCCDFILPGMSFLETRNHVLRNRHIFKRKRQHFGGFNQIFDG